MRRAHSRVPRSSPSRRLRTSRARWPPRVARIYDHGCRAREHTCMTSALAPLNRDALRLFAPIASGYERWSAVLSLGQDPRWRAAMVAGLDLAPGSHMLDVAAGSGLI